jgi:serine protease Do
MKFALWQTVVAVALFALAASAGAQTLGESLKDIPVASHWIYDDLPKAVAQAREMRKPLLVVLRCVPCPPGRALDEQVMQPDDDLAKVEQQFVCLRVIQTNGLDLNVFQYDYDMSWAAMFLNADMTVYGRYGSRSASGKESDGLLTKSGFRAAAERALALHKAYPGNKGVLAAKTGKPAEYATPTAIPGLTDKPEKTNVRQNCIHCHMVKEFAMRAKWEAGKLAGEDLWVYPMPQRIGLTLDVKDGLVVEAVREGSPAAEAGLVRGDHIVNLGGQPLVSTADVQWVLHQALGDTRLAAVIERGDRQHEKTIVLGGDWKSRTLPGGPRPGTVCGRG